MTMEIGQYSDRKKYVEVEKNNILISNLSSSMPSTITNAAILTVVLWKIVSPTKLLVWGGINFAFVFFRYAGIYFYKKNYKPDNFIFWRETIIVSLIIAGALFGSSGIFLVSTSRIEYVVFLYFIVGGMVAGSVGSYHNNLGAYFAYSISVFIIPTISIYFSKGPLAMPMILLGLIFYFIMSINAIRLNRDLTESLLLRYDNLELVTQLNEEQQNTKRLNEKLVENNKKLKELSLVDPLTGLKNRRYLFDIFAKEFNASAENDKFERTDENKRSKNMANGYGVIIIDIDFFKKVNDSHGHDAGDMVLRQFSEKIHAMIRKDDIVVRLGGEEFVIILRHSDQAHLDSLTDKFRRRIQETEFNIDNNKRVQLTCSLGSVYYPFFELYPEITTFGHALSLADQALYFAKENGRNLSARAITPEKLNSDPELLKNIANDISTAISRNEIMFTIIGTHSP